jgi:sec-independent protein translocase protein TatA
MKPHRQDQKKLKGFIEEKIKLTRCTLIHNVLSLKPSSGGFMGQFSLIHWLVVILILMLFFGPNKIESLGKSLGRAIRGFKDGMNEIETSAKEVTEDTQKLTSEKQQQVQTQKAEDKNKA